ncbi:MAG: hypothetical protein HDS68_00070 [Bacteroidales bacterium]|nr:hypothetical protein [Bacteroidales bacterium]
MKVITLSQGAVEWQARELALSLIAENASGFDLMVGVRRGGEFLADALEKFLPEGYCRYRINVTLQRPSTRGKGARLAAVLGNTPLWMLNSARRLEAWWLSMKTKYNKRPDTRKMVVDPGVEFPNLEPHSRILLVDDAIDSGSTIKVVSDSLRGIYVDPKIMIVVITVTTDVAVVEPDFCKYHNRTLVRFPWSIDYKKMMP